jgi:hypothetical protein
VFLYLIDTTHRKAVGLAAPSTKYIVAMLLIKGSVLHFSFLNLVCAFVVELLLPLSFISSLLCLRRGFVLHFVFILSSFCLHFVFT